MKRLVLAFLIFFVVACGDTTMKNAPSSSNDPSVPSPSQALPPTPGNVPVDGRPNYTNSQLPPITVVYSLTLEVQSKPGSLSRFQLEGRSEAYQYGDVGRAEGYIKGEETGKGFLRVKILAVEAWDPFGYAHPANEENLSLVEKGKFYLLKMVDSKTIGLGEGDIVQVKCRVDQELLPPVGTNEVPFLEEVVKELDNCRMLDSEIIPPSK